MPPTILIIILMRAIISFILCIIPGARLYGTPSRHTQKIRYRLTAQQRTVAGRDESDDYFKKMRN